METRSLVMVGIAWVTVGLVTAFMMRRRGHDLATWIALGVVLGPLVVPLAAERARYHGAIEKRSRRKAPPPSEGFDLVAGVDGSEESVAAIRSALALIGDTVTSLTLVSVLDYDSDSVAAAAEPRDRAWARLGEVAEMLGFEPVDKVILYGRADKALSEYARREGKEMIVVGARGHGATEALFGSVTARLVGACEIPVLVGPSTSQARGSPLEVGRFPSAEEGS